MRHNNNNNGLAKQIEKKSYDQTETISRVSKVSIDLKDANVIELNEELKYGSIINETNELKRLQRNKAKKKIKNNPFI